jgi:hypothetical protein
MMRNGQLVRMQYPTRNHPAAFSVQSLPPAIREQVISGNPELRLDPDSRRLADRVEADIAAAEFFEAYEIAPGRHLDYAKQSEYSNGAAILNAFRTILEEASAARAKNGQSRKLNKSDFWRRAAAALPATMDRYPHSLPCNPRALQRKFNNYLNNGYLSLVSGKYLNDNASLARAEVEESALVALLGNGLNLDNEQVCRIYNDVARATGRTDVSVRTVERVRRKHNLVIDATRLGETRMRNQRTMQVKRERPKAPLLFWTVDGWTVELLYQRVDRNSKGQNIRTYTNRLTVVIVLDPCGDYPVGYAIGDHETPELIAAALRNAANHTAELFGARYRVNQIQTDNYGRGHMTPIYEVMGATYTPARVKNAKAKVIEPYFRRLNKKYCQMMPNWAGFGVTADRNKQPNSEWVNAHRHAFPDEAGCRAQIAGIIEREREVKRAAYVEAFGNLPQERRLPLSDESYLLHFGATTGHTNVLEGSGLLPTIMGQKRAYDCFDIKFRNHAHVKWTVRYDPADLSRALAVNDDGSLRFMLEEKYVQPMALADRREGDAEQLARIEMYNDGLFAEVRRQREIVGRHVEELVSAYPQLDVATRLLITDSRGQNKDHKSTKLNGGGRSKPRRVVDAAFEEIIDDAPASGRVVSGARADITTGDGDVRDLY